MVKNVPNYKPSLVLQLRFEALCVLFIWYWYMSYTFSTIFVQIENYLVHVYRLFNISGYG